MAFFHHLNNLIPTKVEKTFHRLKRDLNIRENLERNTNLSN